MQPEQIRLTFGPPVLCCDINLLDIHIDWGESGSGRVCVCSNGTAGHKTGLLTALELGIGNRIEFEFESLCGRGTRTLWKTSSGALWREQCSPPARWTRPSASGTPGMALPGKHTHLQVWDHSLGLNPPCLLLRLESRAFARAASICHCVHFRQQLGRAVYGVCVTNQTRLLCEELYLCSCKLEGIP